LLLPSHHRLWAQVMRTFGGMNLLGEIKKEGGEYEEN